MGDPNNRRPNVVELEDTDCEGDFIPDEASAPRGWGYNVVKVNLSSPSYSILLGGQPTGSEGAAAHFEGRVVIEGPRASDISLLTCSMPFRNRFC